MQIMSGKICCSQNELHKLIMTRIKPRVILIHQISFIRLYFNRCLPNFTCSISFFGQYIYLPICHLNNDLNFCLLTLVATKTVIKCQCSIL